jgi:hypothetical protein
VKINAQTPNGPNITEGSYFGSSVANIFDLDGDGHDDVAVGAIGENLDYGTGMQPNAGAVYIMFMGGNASVKATVRINGVSNNGPKTFAGDQFGYSLARIGDLDGDGIEEIAVGAPGTVTSAVYVLFMFRNGTVDRVSRIRGRYTSSIAVPDDEATANLQFRDNGPPISFGSRFGTALATIGDFNKDGYSDLVVSAIDSGSGHSVLYILYLNYNATVLGYVQLESQVSGMPYIPDFSGFGTSMVMLPDLNNDSIPELAVGAPLLYVAGSLNVRSGQFFVLFLEANGSVNSSTLITEDSGETKYGDSQRRLPFVAGDLCGTGITTIGDINRDNYRQKFSWIPSTERHESIPDLVVGCPQTSGDNLPGRMFFLFLDSERQLQAFAEIPGYRDKRLNIPFPPFGQFGAALAAYQDIDKNGLKEIIVGAPTDDNSGVASGAVYFIFTRRHKNHRYRYDWVAFYLLAVFFPGLCCCFICIGIVTFCYVYRRIPDEVEIIVKKSGYTFDPNKPKEKYSKRPDRIYCDEYVA